MGKKSGITKSGRVMNPADRERKKQRAQELKKNKKQRNIVRHAIVKARDPDEMFEQLRRLDEQEFDPKCELSKHVILEKRTKLKGAIIQQLALYRQENDSNQVTRLENLLHEYEIERQRKEQQHRAVMCSQDLNLGEIPLPGGFMLPNAAMTPYMPPPPMPPTKTRGGVLKSRTEIKVRKDPPGPPCGLPPSFDDDGMSSGTRHARFAGQFSSNYEDYEDFDDDDLAPVAMPDSLLPQKSNFQPVRPLISAPPLPPSMSAVPPPSRHGYQHFAEPPQRQSAITNAVIAAPPVIAPYSATSTNATISAEPQMRNLKKEATRFVPTALHVTRPDTNKPKSLVPNAVSRTKPKAAPAKKPGQSADQVCDDFLREIQDLF